MVGPKYSAPSSPTATVSYSTIYPNSRDLGTAHASLAVDQLRTYAGLRPNQILQCAASLAAGGYYRPCGLIKSLFLLSPACFPIIQLRVFLQLLYPTPSSILTLGTWVQCTNLRLRPTPHVGWPSPNRIL